MTECVLKPTDTRALCTETILDYQGDLPSSGRVTSRDACSLTIPGITRLTRLLGMKKRSKSPPACLSSRRQSDGGSRACGSPMLPAKFSGKAYTVGRTEGRRIAAGHNHDMNR